jgi:leukotriene-A4 hydrolase
MAVVVARVEEYCEPAIQAMANADPDLDPIWGLLVGTGKAASDSGSNDVNEEVGIESTVIDTLDHDAEQKAPNHAQAGHDDVDVLEKLARDVAPPSVAVKPTSNVVDKMEVSPMQFPLLTGEPAPAAERWDIPGCDAFVLDGVLSKAECDHLIAQADGLWSFWDDAERPRVEFRNAHTIEVTHDELADRIWTRVGHLMNPSIVIAEGDERYEVDIEGAWEPYAMNPKKLLSRYLNGGHFSPHTDGTTIVDFNRRTFYSCVLFLNASPWGGHTRIYSDEQIRQALIPDDEGRLTGDPALVLEAVPPVPGRMLVFYHRLMHEGVPAAEKYIIRTDVLYHRSPEFCTSPRDAEAFNMYQEAQLLAEQGHCDGISIFRACLEVT